eukprot:COSAG02_NODE_405_length_23022_cov_14.617764_15_plen_162_part_00
MQVQGRRGQLRHAEPRGWRVPVNREVTHQARKREPPNEQIRRPAQRFTSATNVLRDGACPSGRAPMAALGSCLIGDAMIAVVSGGREHRGWVGVSGWGGGAEEGRRRTSETCESPLAPGCLGGSVSAAGARCAQLLHKRPPVGQRRPRVVCLRRGGGVAGR